jgi:hypothetical protein
MRKKHKCIKVTQAGYMHYWRQTAPTAAPASPTIATNCDSDAVGNMLNIQLGKKSTCSEW